MQGRTKPGLEPLRVSASAFGPKPASRMKTGSAGFRRDCVTIWLHLSSSRNASRLGKSPFSNDNGMTMHGSGFAICG
jgi:hypothetical protein